MPFEYRRAEDVDGALALVTENPGAPFSEAVRIWSTV